MKFKEILDKMGNEVLTEETKAEITKAFDESVNEKINERINLEVTTALQKLDEEHSTKLEKLLETIDTDHTNKLQAIVKKIDEDHAMKFKEVVDKYETILKEEAVKFHENMVNEVSNYIELYIDKAIPAETIAEAVENTRAKKMIDAIKEIVSVDEEYIKENVKEALEDGMATIEQLRAELNETIKENIKVQQELKGTKAELILEKKTATMPKEKKNFVMRVLNNKSPEYITENFDYVTEMFTKEENDKVAVLTEEAKKEAISKSVDTPKSETPSTGFDEEVRSPVNEYLAEMKKVDKK